MPLGIRRQNQQLELVAHVPRQTLLLQQRVKSAPRGNALQYEILIAQKYFNKKFAANLCQIFAAPATLVLLAEFSVAFIGCYRKLLLLQCKSVMFAHHPVLLSPQNIFSLIAQIATVIGLGEAIDQCPHMANRELCSESATRIQIGYDNAWGEHHDDEA